MSRGREVHRLRVGTIEQLTDDAVALTFEVPPELAEVYAFTAGQHITIVGDDGVRRSFSLCSPPSAGVLRIGVKRLPGGVFSHKVLDELRVGDELDVMAPSGSFTVVPDPDRRAHYVAIAAGSGITPVLAIMAALLEGEPGSEVTLLYANRTQRSIMFLDEIGDLKDRWPARLQVVHVLSREEQDVALLSGRLDADRLRRILAELVPDHVGAVDGWFICGPQQMVVELRNALVVDGVDPHAVHTELFHADPVSRPRASLEGVADGAAAVTIRMDGRSSDLALRPDGPSVLEAALEVRPDLPFACRGGVCGTCRARLIEGTVDLDAAWALEPEEIEQGYVLTCQAHPTSPRVVLDYDG